MGRDGSMGEEEKDLSGSVGPTTLGGEAEEGASRFNAQSSVARSAPSRVSQMGKSKEEGLELLSSALLGSSASFSLSSLLPPFWARQGKASHLAPEARSELQARKKGRNIIFVGRSQVRKVELGSLAGWVGGCSHLLRPLLSLLLWRNERSRP